MTNTVLSNADLPVIDPIDFKKHPKRFLKKGLIANMLFLVPLLIGILILFFFVDEWMWIYAGLLFWLLLLLLMLLTAYKGYFIKGYILREHDVTYRKGWIFRHQTTIPFNRIQHTEINHGPIDRLFNLCELDIYTAGGSASDLSISGLDPDRAASIKEFISARTARHV